MAKDENQSHVEDILNILSEKSDKKVSREEIEREFDRFMEYGVPIDQAKQTLIKKFGGGGVVFTSSSTSERTLISDLKPNQTSVKLLGHVIAINPKEITVRGENRRIFYGIIGDESGTVPFTAWNKVELEKGDVVEVNNAYTREWQGTVQLNFGDRVRIEKTDKEKLPESAFKPKETTINELKSGMGRVDVTGRILEINEREADVGGETKKVFSGIIGDETGKSQFTSWHDFKIKEGDVLRITGGYVKSWKGIPQLTFDSNASVKKLDKKKIIEKDLKSIRMPIHELVEKRGALDIEIEGTIVDIRPGSGLVKRCPDCNRVLMNDECSIHGKVKGNLDLRLKIVVDDGTGTVNTTLNKNLSEKVLGIDFEESKKKGDDDFLNEINTKLFARRILLKGNALSDEFGTTVIPKNAEFVEVDLNKETEILLKEVEELL
ncbi:MAG TPA: DNA-binding protein [Bacteroidetes bacterium]|nr:DNA-binding protein [Bacteroidota bacterium]